MLSHPRILSAPFPYCGISSKVGEANHISWPHSWRWILQLGIPSTGVNRHDMRTWDLKGDWLPSEKNGIISGFGFGQSRFMWNLRLMPRVKRAFEAIWNTKDLIVSFDGGNVFRPWAYKWVRFCLARQIASHLLDCIVPRCNVCACN